MHGIILKRFTITIFLEALSCDANTCAEGQECELDEDGNPVCFLLIQDVGLEYLFINESRKNWTAASIDCQERGYNLTTVLSKEEANFVASQGYVHCMYCT